MLNTGFYDVATRKAGERQAVRDDEFERKKKRMEELNIKIVAPTFDSDFEDSFFKSSSKGTK